MSGRGGEGDVVQVLYNGASWMRGQRLSLETRDFYIYIVIFSFLFSKEGQVSPTFLCFLILVSLRDFIFGGKELLIANIFSYLFPL